MNFIRLVEIIFEKKALEEYKQLEKRAIENKDCVEAKLFFAARDILDEFQ